MKIIRAQHFGMCFGVRDAIALAKKTAQDGPLTILGELVHNETVLNELRSAGIAIESRLDKVTTRRAMVTAHGASDKLLKEAATLGLEVVQATCPLVHHAHRAVRGLVAQGYHLVIVGKADHVEVRGMTEDLDVCDIVLSEDDILNLRERPRFGVAAQTTQPIEKARYLVECLRRRFPKSEVRFVDTVCHPTKQRQSAAEELARNCDVVIVVGGATSNNTRELVQTCRRHCERVHHVQSPGDLNPEWWGEDETLGITAGTSTPDVLIAAVEQKIQSYVPSYEH